MPEILVPRLIFIVLAVIILVPITPIRWSLGAYLLLVHLNLSGSDFASASALGIANSISIIIFPLVLLWRVGFSAWPILIKKWGFRFWLLLGIYMAVASIWSPFQLAAVKQLGFFFAYTVTLLIFTSVAIKDKDTSYVMITWTFFLAMGLAVVQTFLLDNQFGGLENRFTSFSAPQSFGLYLVLTFVFLTAFNFDQSGRFKMNFIALPMLLLGILLTGSRTAFVAVSLLVSIWLLLWCFKDLTYGRVIVVLTGTNICVFTLIIFIFTPLNQQVNITKIVQERRSLQILAATDQSISLSDIGTFEFRLAMYQTILDRLQHSTEADIILGHGTSSIGALVIDGYIYYRNFNQTNIDANRIAHNEYLRTIYEWGVIGVLLFACFQIIVVLGSLHMVIKKPTFEKTMLWFGLLMVFLYLALENILAASGTPGGLAITLLFAQLISLSQQRLPTLNPSSPQPS